MKAAIIGLAGPELTREERALLVHAPPAGIILFARNIGGPRALAALIGDLREVAGPDLLLLVDQEGGRVARLRPPAWRAHPAAGAIGAVWRRDPARGQRLAFVTGALIGLDCAGAGFDVACAPVLDLGRAETTAAIGDRAFGADPAQVAVLGMALADGLLAAGIQPVGKHAPGHGWARADSHAELPRVPRGCDLAPDVAVFSACNQLPWLMTAHVLYEAIDPACPATLSPTVIGGIIRDLIGFGGVVVSDDLAMGALAGPAGARAAGALAAGCDLALHCSGELAENREVLQSVPDLSAETRARLRAARLRVAEARMRLDGPALAAEQDALLR